MFGKIALSIAAIGVLAISAIAVKNKHDEIENTKKQVKVVLQYETKQKNLHTDSYADLKVKPETLFITQSQKDKDLLKKMRKAVAKEVITHPSNETFSCNTLASTGEITLSECNYLQSKKFDVILPTNTAVEETAKTNINSIDNNDSNHHTVTQVVTATVANHIAPASNSEVSSDYSRKLQQKDSVASITHNNVKAEKTVKEEKKISKAMTAIVSNDNNETREKAMQGLLDIAEFHKKQREAEENINNNTNTASNTNSNSNGFDFNVPSGFNTGMFGRNGGLSNNINPTRNTDTVNNSNGFDFSVPSSAFGIFNSIKNGERTIPSSLGIRRF